MAASAVLLSNFGDESADWLSHILEEMWPYAQNIMRSILTEYIHPAIVANMPAIFPTIHFTKIQVGTRAPRIESVCAFRGGDVANDVLIVEADVSFDGNPHIELSLGSPSSNLNFGIDSAKLRGRYAVLPILFRRLLARLQMTANRAPCRTTHILFCVMFAMIPRSALPCFAGERW